MKNLTLIITLVICFFTGIIYSCTNDSEFDNSFEKNDDVVNLLLTKSNISPLNKIPQGIKKNLSNEENVFFSKMSSVFFIDYSFINTELYQNNKEQIFSELQKSYDYYHNNNIKGVYLIVDQRQESSRALAQIEAVAPTEISDYAMIYYTKIKHIENRIASFNFTVYLNIEDSGYSMRDWNSVIIHNSADMVIHNDPHVFCNNLQLSTVLDAIFSSPDGNHRIFDVYQLNLSFPPVPSRNN